MLKTLIISALCALFTIPSLFACMAAPKQIVKGVSKDKTHQYSLKLSGEMNVTKDGNKVWDVKLKNYSQYFDRIFLLDNGAKVVQIRGNHRIKSLDDIAIYIYSKEGFDSSISVKQFINKLQPGSKSITGPDGVARVMRSSMDPKFKWMSKIENVDGKGVKIVNALGENKSILWEKA
jgi:hypothetical protein